MKNTYWKIFAEEVPAELGINLTDKQIEQLTDALEGAHENYGLHSGQEIADSNWRAAQDRELQHKGAESVLRYIEDRVATIDGRPSGCFKYMSTEQRLAMHEIFQARSFLMRCA